jgi:hypothetical protein
MTTGYRPIVRDFADVSNHSMPEEPQPVGTGADREDKEEKNHRQDQATADARTRATAAEPKTVFQPLKDSGEKGQLEQAL